MKIKVILTSVGHFFRSFVGIEAQEYADSPDSRALNSQQKSAVTIRINNEITSEIMQFIVIMYFPIDLHQHAHNKRKTIIVDKLVFYVVKFFKVYEQILTAF